MLFFTTEEPHMGQKLNSVPGCSEVHETTLTEFQRVQITELLNNAYITAKNIERGHLGRNISYLSKAELAKALGI
jgi:hypothetical protein